MHANNTLTPKEKILGVYGSLTLTTKRIIGEENASNLALGGFGRVISKIINFNSTSHISGTSTEIKLDKIDSIKFTINRKNFLLELSNLLWFATIFLLVMIWIINPFKTVLRQLIDLVGIILNLITIGLIREPLNSMSDFLFSLSSDHYEVPVFTFIASIFLFVIYIMFKKIKLEVHSSKNLVFTNISDFSFKNGLKEAQSFAKKIREAEYSFNNNG